MALSRLGIRSEDERLLGLLANDEVAVPVRLAAFEALASTGRETLLKAVRTARESSEDAVRQLGGQWQTRLPVDEAIQLYREDLAEESVTLRRTALRGLGKLDDQRAGRLLETWFEKLLQGNVANELILDLLDAAASSSYKPLEAKRQAYEAR